MGDELSRLPKHERRRLQALGTTDVETLARRRLAGEPLQYLEGSAQFTDFEVAVDDRVMVPRPETEGLFELVSGLDPAPKIAVDLGTGSGVLALAVARCYPRAEVHGVDLSPEAIEVARANGRSLGLAVEFHVGDLFSALPARLRHRIDLVVSNPPYVAEREWDGLPPDVKQEPRVALISGPTGTEVLERIAAQASGWLTPGATIACEMGESQANSLRAVFSSLGEVTVHHDLAGRPRYLMARRKP